MPASAARIDLVGAVKDAALTALLALFLLLPLIGFITYQNIHNELTFESRFPLLFRFVAIAGVGRLVYLLTILPWRERRAQRARPTPSTLAPAWRTKLARLFAPSAVGFVLLYPAIVLALVGFQGGAKWIDNFGIQILIYVMLGFGLNIVVGLAGLLDLGYVAFYAVGAYAYALLAKTFGLSFFMLLPLAGCLAAFWGILLGFPVLRLRGDYLAIVTLAFGEIIRLVLINWVPVTNGYAGITGVPRPTFFGIPFNADDDGFAAVFGLEFTPVYRTIFLYYVILSSRCSRPSSRCGCAACRSGAPGRRCARTRSPAARSASTRPTPSLPPSRWAPCSPASQARSSRRARASSHRSPSRSSNPRRSSRSSCSAAWAARSASPSRQSR